MGQSVFPAPSSGYSVPNWQLVTSATPSGVSTVTFSGLSGYAKYRILAQGIVAVNGYSEITFNGDSSNHYSYGSVYGASSSPSMNQNVSTIVSSTNGLNPSYDLQIDNALILAPKTFQGWIAEGTANNSLIFNLNGVYQTTSLLTSITITRTANFTSGSIYLLGAN